MKGWIGVDLDGTLAEYEKFKGASIIGSPINKMVLRVKYWLAKGLDVRIVTARVFPIGINYNDSGIGDYDEYMKRTAEALEAATAIKKWCIENLGRELPIQCWKDYGMYELWDDRAIQIIPNTGDRADGRGKLEPHETWYYEQLLGIE